MIYVIIFAVILIALVIISYFFVIYNALIALKQNIKKAWANIDVILKQRYDEIPQLIQICEQYASYEKSMIDKITSAREKMVHGNSKKEQMDGAQALNLGIKGLLAVGEAYPDLKANKNFMQIQDRLSSLEESLADRREYYNDTVNQHNIRIKQIPDVFIAGFLGYQDEDLFQVGAHERERPDLKMNI